MGLIYQGKMIAERQELGHSFFTREDVDPQSIPQDTKGKDENCKEVTSVS